ncbi:hypothetical protein AB1Y20_018684 [Prymnesium parvum]|uniref:Adenylate kinase n=1 Tax=Prymnesium parvum TaxID=97485 RepID=A0AB34JP97_PRYPA
MSGSRASRSSARSGAVGARDGRLVPSPRTRAAVPASPRSRPRATPSSTQSPLKATVTARQVATDCPRSPPAASASSDRQTRRDSSERVAALEREVQLLRQQLQQQAEVHQADLSLLRTEQSLRRAALEEGLRADAAEAERALCSHFAEERMRAAVEVESSASKASAAAHREMRCLRMQLSRFAGVALVVGPPCAGKTTVGRALSSRVGVTFASLPSLLKDASLRGGAEGDLLRAAVLHNSPLPPAMALRLLLRALPAAADGLLLLEVPSDGGLLPSLLLHTPPPCLLLLVDATHRLLVRRQLRRGVPSAARAAEAVRAYRRADEAVARAFGERFAGRLCVVDGRTRHDELPAVLCGALHAASLAAVWAGVREVGAPPLLVTGAEGAAEGAAATMAARWGLEAVSSSRVLKEAAGSRGSGEEGGGGEGVAGEEEGGAAAEERGEGKAEAGGAPTLAEQAACIERALDATASRGVRCVLHAAADSLPPTLLALRQWAARRGGGEEPRGAACVAFVAQDGGPPLLGGADAAETELLISLSHAGMSGASSYRWLPTPRFFAPAASKDSPMFKGFAAYAVEPTAAQRCQEALAAAGVACTPFRATPSELETLSTVAHTLLCAALGVAEGAAPPAGETAAAASPREPRTPSCVSSRGPPSAEPPTPPPAAREARGVVIFSSASPQPARGATVCAQAAKLLGAAHLALPKLLRAQLAISASAGRPAGRPDEPSAGGSLAAAIRAGKLVSGAPALQVLQTAVHAAPQLLILIEHTPLDGPLDVLVGCVRPHLVILQRDDAAGIEGGTIGSGDEGAGIPHSRRQYELRALRALGDAAPPIRACVGGAEEAVAIICEHLSRAKHEEDSADELLSADGDEDATLCDEERMWDRPDFSHSSTVR